MKKKGQALQGFVGQIIVFGVLVVAVAVMAIILSNFQADQTTDSLPYNITGDGLTGLENVSTQTPTLATILISVLILSAVVGLIFLFRSR